MLESPSADGLTVSESDMKACQGHTSRRVTLRFLASLFSFRRCRNVVSGTSDVAYVTGGDALLK